ncbi:DUF4097 family beta strand repeat-containing protein [soil metagenome]
MNTRMLLALTVWALPAYAGDKIEERADADPRGEVEVSNISGSVEISGWDRNQVEVKGRLGDSAERLEFVPERRHTLIKVVYSKNHEHRGGDLDTKLMIRLPAQSRLEVTTVSADIAVADMKGRQSLGTVSGDVVTAVAGERIDLRTVSGDARVTGDGSQSELKMQTVSGDAVVRDVGGELTVTSVSGDLQVFAGRAERVTARSTSGEIGLNLGLAEDASIEAETVSGEVVLDLEDGGNADYAIETFSGDIDNCFGPKPQRKSQYAPGTELRFVTGNGSAQVRVNTLSGSIELCDRVSD